MNSIIATRIQLAACLSLALLAATTATAQPLLPLIAGTDGGVWIAAWGDGTTSCTPLGTTPPISTCDLPWSFGHPRSAIAQFHQDGGFTMLLPYPHSSAIWPCCGGGPAMQNFAGLVLSEFAGKWSRTGMGTGGSPTGDIQLNLVSAVGISDFTATVSPQWGGIPVHDFGFLKVLATLKFDSKTNMLSGPFQYTLMDLNGKALFQFGGTLTMRSFNGTGGIAAARHPAPGSLAAGFNLGGHPDIIQGGSLRSTAEWAELRPPIRWRSRGNHRTSPA